MTALVPIAAETFKVMNVAFELISAGTLVMSRVTELQEKRAAEGRQMTQADLDQLMAEGDVQAKLERAQLAAALLAQARSGPAS